MDEPCRLEHANLTVTDLDAAVRFYRTAFPHWRIRWRARIHGVDWDGDWLHLGTDAVYVALQSAKPGADGRREPYEDPGHNHLGFVVDDLDAVRERLTEAGYEEGLVVPPHPFRKRMYWHDPDGNEVEFIEYLSDVPGERNDYSDVDEPKAL